MINIKNFIIGAIISFGSIALAMWFGRINDVLDFVLLFIMLIGVPGGMIIACYPKDDVKVEVDE